MYENEQKCKCSTVVGDAMASHGAVPWLKAEREKRKEEKKPAKNKQTKPSCQASKRS